MNRQSVTNEDSVSKLSGSVSGNILPRQQSVDKLLTEGQTLFGTNTQYLAQHLSVYENNRSIVSAFMQT